MKWSFTSELLDTDLRAQSTGGVGQCDSFVSRRQEKFIVGSIVIQRGRLYRLRCAKQAPECRWTWASCADLSTAAFAGPCNGHEPLSIFSKRRRV